MTQLSPAKIETGLGEAGWLGWFLALSSLLSTSIVPALARGVIVSGVSPTLLLVLRLGGACLLLTLTFAMFNRQRFWVERRGLSLISVVGFISGVEICCFFGP